METIAELAERSHLRMAVSRGLHTWPEVCTNPVTAGADAVDVGAEAVDVGWVDVGAADVVAVPGMH